MPLHSGTSLFLQTRLPLRGQRRLNRPEGRRTGFPFNPASRRSMGHLRRADCTSSPWTDASIIGKPSQRGHADAEHHLIATSLSLGASLVAGRRAGDVNSSDCMWLGNAASAGKSLSAAIGCAIK